MTRWLLITFLVCGCDAPTDVDAGAPDAASTDAGSRPPEVVGPEERPARLYAPPAHDGTTELPLIVLLHGRSVDAMLQDLYFGMTRQARTEGFYLLLPDGTINAAGQPHWDTTGLLIDDHAYLRGLIEEVIGLVPVDRSALSLIGHSNGSFMAFRLACDSADLVTSIAGLAGSDAIVGCTPSDDVSVLHIHGTADSTVFYDGGSIAGLDYPAAPVVVETWATRVGCDPASSVTGAPLDLTTDVDGSETQVLAYESGCRAGVELWTMDAVDHIPALTGDFTPALLGWLRAHPR